MALRQTYSSLCRLSSLTLDVAAISMSKISTKPWTQLPSSLPHTDTEDGRSMLEGAWTKQHMFQLTNPKNQNHSRHHVWPLNCAVSLFHWYLLRLRSGEKMSFPGWPTDLHISPIISTSSQQHSSRWTWSRRLSSTNPETTTSRTETSRHLMRNCWWGTPHKSWFLRSRLIGIQL